MASVVGSRQVGVYSGVYKYMQGIYIPFGLNMQGMHDMVICFGSI